MKQLDKKLTKDGIFIRINNTDKQIKSVDTIRIYSLIAWTKHLHGDKDEISNGIIPEYRTNVQKYAYIQIKPESCTPTLIFIEIGLTLADDTTKTIHTTFINEFSIFKAKTKYLEGLTSCNTACSYPCVACNNCKEYKDLLSLMTFMLRLSLLKDAYIYNNEELTVKYYRDLQRHVNMDLIPFSYLDTDREVYTNPDRVHDLFRILNNEVKHNVSPCAKKIFEGLLISDLYDLLFSLTRSAKNDWILDDHIWDMKDEFWYDNKVWKD